MVIIRTTAGTWRDSLDYDWNLLKLVYCLMMNFNGFWIVEEDDVGECD